MSTETLNFPQAESFDFNQPAVRNKIQLEVADAFGIPKAELSDWIYDNSPLMREIISSEEFREVCELKDWEAARQVIIDHLIDKRRDAAA